MRNWDNLLKKIGPLRYQTSKSDCVPTTVINGLMIVREAQIEPKLLQYIWGVSLDLNNSGTGWVSCKLLAHVLESWFAHAHEDNCEKEKVPLKSEIVEGDAVHLDRNNQIMRCLNSGGVACLTTNNGSHYSLLIAHDGGNKFLGFDPFWNEKSAQQVDSEEFKKYHGLVNTKWTRDNLIKVLRNKHNQWIHLISKTTK